MWIFDLTFIGHKFSKLTTGSDYSQSRGTFYTPNVEMFTRGSKCKIRAASLGLDKLIGFPNETIQRAACVSC